MSTPVITVQQIGQTIETFAPTNLQESYDNSGLQLGSPSMHITGVLLCLDVTEQVVDEAIARGMNMIVSHHPVLFHGLKQITGRTVVERIVIKALQHNIAIYSAHTNLDSARGGVSSEMAHRRGLRNQQVLVAHPQSEYTGLGIVGDIEPMPAIEFLRKLKEIFEVQ